MILNSLMKHKYTFDLYELTPNTESPDGAPIYEYVERRTGTIASGRGQSYLFTQEPLNYADGVAEVQDSKGDFVFQLKGEPYSVYVWSCEPVVDIYGRVTNYRSTLRRNQPKDPVGGSH